MAIKILITIVCLAVFIPYNLMSQDNTARPSPAKEAIGKINETNVLINYSSPSVKGRAIWGELVPYGKVWRTGANEATTFEIDQDLEVQGQKLAAGKYALFTIPGEKEWIWIFNSVWDQWGAFKYDASKDILRVNVVPQQSPVFHEQLMFEVAEGKTKIYWENLVISL